MLNLNRLSIWIPIIIINDWLNVRSSKINFWGGNTVRNWNVLLSIDDEPKKKQQQLYSVYVCMWHNIHVFVIYRFCFGTIGIFILNRNNNINLKLWHIISWHQANCIRLFEWLGVYQFKDKFSHLIPKIPTVCVCVYRHTAGSGFEWLVDFWFVVYTPTRTIYSTMMTHSISIRSPLDFIRFNVWIQNVWMGQHKVGGNGFVLHTHTPFGVRCSGYRVKTYGYWANLPVLTNLNVTLLCDLMVSLNVIWVQSFKIPDEVAIIRVVVVVRNDGYSLKLLMWLLLEVPVPDKAPPLRQLLNRLRLVFVTLSICVRCHAVVSMTTITMPMMMMTTTMFHRTGMIRCIR